MCRRSSWAGACRRRHHYRLRLHRLRFNGTPVAGGTSAPTKQRNKTRTMLENRRAGGGGGGRRLSRTASGAFGRGGAAGADAYVGSGREKEGRRLRWTFNGRSRERRMDGEEGVGPACDTAVATMDFAAAFQCLVLVRCPGQLRAAVSRSRRCALAAVQRPFRGCSGSIHARPEIGAAWQRELCPSLVATKRECLPACQPALDLICAQQALLPPGRSYSRRRLYQHPGSIPHDQLNLVPCSCVTAMAVVLHEYHGTRSCG